MKTVLAKVRRHQILLLVLLVAFLFCRTWMMRAGPERLIDIVQFDSIRGERMYRLELPTSADAPYTLISQSVLDGSLRKQAVPLDKSEQVTIVHIGADAVYLRREPRMLGAAIATGAVVGGGVSLPSKPQPVGRPKQPPSPPTRVRVKRLRPHLPPLALLRLPLAGGAPQEVPGVDARQAIIVERTVYWIKRQPDELWNLEEQVQGKTTRVIQSDVVGHSQLMMTPLDAGETREVARGVPEGAQLVPGEDGVIWTIIKPTAAGERRMDIYRFHRSDAHPSLVASVIPANLYAPSSMVERGGRLFWRQFEPVTVVAPLSGSTDLPPHLSIAQALPEQRAHLIMAAGDGSAPRKLEVKEIAESGARGFPYLSAHRGHLYTCLSTSQPPKDGVVKTTTWLCRLHTTDPPRVEKLLRLPVGNSGWGQFDGDYWYFPLTEEREKFFDWSKEGLRTTSVHVLYRYRLPH
jgi:hypothetical protein